MKKILSVLAILGLIGTSAFAGAIVSNIPLALTKQTSCGIAVKAQTYSIGSVFTGTDLTAAGYAKLPSTELYVECDNAVPYTVYTNTSNDTLLSMSSSPMYGVGLRYFKDSGYTQTLTSTNKISGTGNNAVQTLTIYPALVYNSSVTSMKSCNGDATKMLCAADTYTGSVRFIVEF